MSETKFTKGEWKLDLRSPSFIVSSINNTNTIAKVYRSYKTDEEIEANAKLISAAPDLLEALQEVVRISDRKHDAWDKAKAAIKKATT